MRWKIYHNINNHTQSSRHLSRTPNIHQDIFRDLQTQTHIKIIYAAKMLPPVTYTESQSRKSSLTDKIFGGSHPLRNLAIPDAARTPAASTPANSRKSSLVIPYGRSGHSSRRSSSDSKKSSHTVQPTPYGRNGYSEARSSSEDSKKPSQKPQPYGRSGYVSQ